LYPGGALPSDSRYRFTLRVCHVRQTLVLDPRVIISTMCGEVKQLKGQRSRLRTYDNKLYRFGDSSTGQQRQTLYIKCSNVVIRRVYPANPVLTLQGKSIAFVSPIGVTIVLFELGPIVTLEMLPLGGKCNCRILNFVTDIMSCQL